MVKKSDEQRYFKNVSYHNVVLTDTFRDWTSYLN